MGERNELGRFAPGNRGKPTGALHRVTTASQNVLKGESEALTRKTVEVALKGDVNALRICMERLHPVRKDAPVQFDLPPLTGPADLPAAMSAILRAVAEGRLTPTEGSTLSNLVDKYRAALETTEMSQRISALEEERRCD